MPLTVADWLPGIRPHLARELLSPQGLSRLERLARHLPGACLAALEIPLPPAGGTLGTAADLSVRIRRSTDAVETAARLPPSPSRSFLRRWSEDARLRARVPEVWIEFDVVGTPEPPIDSLPPPVVCARLTPDAEAGWLVDELLPGLHGGGRLPNLQRRAALEALSALPSSARPLYAFSLRSRCPEPVAADRVPIRLEIHGLEARQLTPFLTRLAETDSATKVRSTQIEALLPLVRAADRNHLSFDLAPGPQPRVGVELSFRGLPGREPGWSWLLDRVLALAGVEKAVAGELGRALWAWPGWSSFWTEPETWPAAAGAGYCVRSLSHFKVMTWPDRNPRAKVYLLFGHWRRRGSPSPGPERAAGP